MKKIFLCAMLLLLFVGAKKDAQGPVYIVHADQGSLTLQGKNEASLQLEKLDQTVPYVYSHPRRRIGAERLPEFMRVWASGNKLQYGKSLPNANLLYYHKSYGEYINLFVELSSVDYDEKNNSIQFQLLFHDKEPQVKENLGEVTLFIDCFPFCI